MIKAAVIDKMISLQPSPCRLKRTLGFLDTAETRDKQQQPDREDQMLGPNVIENEIENPNSTRWRRVEQQPPATNSELVYWLHRILQDHTQAPPSIGRKNLLLTVFACETQLLLYFHSCSANHFFSSQSKIIRELKPSILQSSSNRSF